MGLFNPHRSSMVIYIWYDDVCYADQDPEENNGLCLWEEPEDEEDDDEIEEKPEEDEIEEDNYDDNDDTDYDEDTNEELKDLVVIDEDELELEE